MRISTIQAFNNGVQGLQKNYANAIRTQEQISTGNRILTPADDPVASVRLLQLEQQQSVLGQYKENLTAAKNSLKQEEVTLNSVNTVLQRVRELAVQAGNGALSQVDRESIAAELGEREDELLGLMNTRNARGEYLFAGFQGKTQPFVRQADGTYSYEGDEGQRKLQIGSSLNVPISDSGKKVFQNITNAERVASSLTVSPTGSTLSVSNALVQDEVSFAATPAFPDAGISVVFGNPDAASYEVFAYGTATPALATGKLDSNPEQSDKLVFRGVTLQFDGVPVGGETVVVGAKSTISVAASSNPAQSLTVAITDPAATVAAFTPVGPLDFTIEAEAAPSTDFNFAAPLALIPGFSSVASDYPLTVQSNGLSITLAVPPVAGDTFTLGRQAEEKQGILDTIANLRMALEGSIDSPVGNRETRDAVAAALSNIDLGMNTVDSTRGELGARMNIIDTTQADNDDVTLVNKGVQANLRELDYAEALSRLSFQTVILEAAQQSYVKISGLSLFNQLR
ncbi:MAG: flagellar hook-associated protein 3 [Gammaproteobacteria bacterium]|nr:flagellar hook-associated protein 3 [Gammaproteobacteria bacterium]MBU0884937.1 flagellar hook-associated protein 3 [Gammaproteobacteria bacterium]MBU1859557.1 flagellar hook-associated protein 3 [Gammaproteobacteria bacterium]